MSSYDYEATNNPSGNEDPGYNNGNNPCGEDYFFYHSNDDYRDDYRNDSDDNSKP